MTTRFALLAWILGCAGWHPCAAQDAAHNWPQWRGPLANGVAPHADPPIQWSEQQNVKWKVPCPGQGSATPIIWENKIFVLTAVASERPAGTSATADSAADVAGQASTGEPTTPQAEPPPSDSSVSRGPRGRMRGSSKPTVPYKFEVLCFDRQTGKLIWQRTAREEVPHEGVRAGDGTYASYSPVTDGKHLYAYFGSRGLYCYDLDGNLRWEKDLGQLRIAMEFGEGGSPALHGNTLIVNRDHEGESHIMALDKQTGETVWRVDRDERTSWSTPLVVQHSGQAQVIVTATQRTRSYDLETGQLIWECGGQTRNVIPSPVAMPGMVLATSGFRGSSLQAIELGRSGDLTDSDAIRWSVNRGTPYVPSPLLYGDQIFLFSGNNAILSCYDVRTGDANYAQERVEGLGSVYASPVGAADRVYLVGRDGTAVVIQRSKDLEILATNKLDEGFDASPALAGGDLLLRGHRYLYCLSQ